MEVVKQSMTCDVLIMVGTSPVVSPANTLRFYAKNNQAAIVDINPENTPISYETAAKGLSRFIPILASKIRRPCTLTVVLRTEIWPQVQSITTLAREVSRNFAIFIWAEP